jgi:hypothetical protein
MMLTAEPAGVPVELFVMVLVFVIGIAGVFIWTLIAMLKGQPSIMAWTDRPLGKEPAMIVWRGRKYVCLPVESEANSWQFVQDVLGAAEKIRDERLAKERKKLPG